MPWYTSKWSPRSFKAAATRAERLREREAAIRTLDKRGEPVTEAAITAVLASWEPSALVTVTSANQASDADKSEPSDDAAAQGSSDAEGDGRE